MSEEDFMKDILADAESPTAMSPQSRALEHIRKFNLPTRFTIHTDRPIPLLSGSFSRAFEVHDAKQKEDIYALILPSSIPIRFHAIQQLKMAFHHNFVNVLESGLTEVAGGQFGNYAVILEKPKGRKLSEFIKDMRVSQKKDETKEQKTVLHEDFISQEIIQPINEVLKTILDNGLSHGRINHENIYLDKMENPNVVLGECVSEPCGYSQPPQYETIERAQAIPLGKGNSNIKHDYFAFGVLIYYCMFGEVPAYGMEPSELIKARISKGTYNVYLGQHEISSRMVDILRGLLTDNPAERWGYDQISSWLKGKRFNLIRPSVRKEAARGYEFSGGVFFSKRALANSYHQKWDEAALDIRDKRLPKWLDLSTADKNLGDDVAVIITSTGGEKTKSRSDNDELISKTIILMDMEAPIRYRDICMHLDGMGAVLANAWAHQNQSELQSFVDIIRMNLPNFKAVRESTDNDKVDRWILQRQQNYIKLKSLGFGIERVLYDLNPTLPCQSPMLASQFVIDVSQLLFFLNDHAAKLAGNEPVDRHISAFITSKLELASEVKLKIMARFHRNETAITQLTKLALLAFAQKKTKVNKLPGLAGWMNEKLKVIINSIHSRQLKKEFSEEMKNIAGQGNLEAMLSLITNSEYFARDDEGFVEARQHYALLDADIKLIRAREKLAMGQDVYYLSGLQFCKILAALVFIVSLGLMVPW